MARPRRLRHKLMLGLALVVGSIMLLLGGSLYGLNAYLNAVKTTNRKLYEIQYVSAMVGLLTANPRSAQVDITVEARDLNAKADDTRAFAQK